MVGFLHTGQGKHSTGRCTLHRGDGLQSELPRKIFRKVSEGDGVGPGADVLLEKVRRILMCERIGLRLRLLIKGMFDNGSLDLVGTAGKSQIKNIRDLYTGSSSSSKGQIESTVKEIKQYRFNKRSLDDYHQANISTSTKRLRDEEIDETEIFDSGDGSMSPCEAVVKAKKEKKLRQEIMTSGLPAKPARINLDVFAKVFRDMPDDQKWRLSTGKVIEDALFKFGMRCNEEQ
ncbi:hypothetical protein BC938DRAFT_479687 [Jimgerdemannia flammicorona]|uniref:Uncharacterized protein n=1 Tax=Jimgerdemannia flammicorona TaxID=994334 RepID=A0A433QKD8_9FUNG|nr:hypothetical protein BC938DRAFT_479687 [Jimgerdemannia flammicorona]